MAVKAATTTTTTTFTSRRTKDGPRLDRNGNGRPTGQSSNRQFGSLLCRYTAVIMLLTVWYWSADHLLLWNDDAITLSHHRRATTTITHVDNASFSPPPPPPPPGPPPPVLPQLIASQLQQQQQKQHDDDHDRPNRRHRHDPRRFSTQTRLNIDRGMNIINCWSGHHMATWIYEGRRPVRSMYRSWKHENETKFLYSARGRGGEDDAAGGTAGAGAGAGTEIRDGDTLFVAHVKLDEFVVDFLPSLRTDVVIISTPFHTPYPRGLEGAGRQIAHHPHVLHWFVTNTPRYTGGQQDHPNVSSFPLGLKPKMGSHGFRNPIPHYRDAFLKHYHPTGGGGDDSGGDDDGGDSGGGNEMTKTKTIFVGPLSLTTPKRRGIPSGRSMKYPRYLDEMAKARYVLSPDGDHPDCHRHYEAIGLGTIPITQLDPKYYGHLQEGGTIYNNTEWNVTKLETMLSTTTTTLTTKVASGPRATPNRNMVFEEYWMEHIERKVGRTLRWWDTVQQRPAMLSEFVVQKKREGGDTI